MFANAPLRPALGTRFMFGGKKLIEKFVICKLLNTVCEESESLKNGQHYFHKIHARLQQQFPLSWGSAIDERT